MDESKVAVVVGANRGIGLGFVEEYLKKGYNVVGTYRDELKLDALKTLQEKYPGSLTLYQLDLKASTPEEIGDFEKKVEAFAETVKSVDILILNAGIKGYLVSGTETKNNTGNELLRALAVNTIAPDIIIRAFRSKLLRKNACVAYMSSLVGMTADNTGGNYHPYRISKAGSDMAIWDWCIQLLGDWEKLGGDLSLSPCAVAICPGWVRTDMGGPSARLSVEESVSMMVNVIEDVIQTKKCNGLLMYNNKFAEEYKIPDVLQRVFFCIKEKVLSSVETYPHESGATDFFKEKKDYVKANPLPQAPVDDLDKNSTRYK